MTRILVATSDGIRTFDPAGSAGPDQLPERDVTFLAPEGEELWAILDRAEVWRTAGGDRWSNVGNVEGHRANCIADTRTGVVVGASDARLFRVLGEGVQPVEAFDATRGRDEWYTPWGGPPDVRSISEDADAVYANVHVGGIVRSRDGGDSWVPTIDIHADVHQVTTAPGWVLAACARGLAVSEDQGESWNVRTEGLDAPYARAVAVCGDAVLMSASRGPSGGRAAVYRGELKDGALERCRTGLPEWFEDNVDSHRLDADPHGSLAAFGTNDGRVFASEDEGATWSELAGGLPSVHRVLVIP